jgi:Domain of unknown function (DUF3854)
VTGYSIVMHAQHAKLLEDSAIPPELASRREYVTVDTLKRVRDLRVVKSATVPGLLIPLRDKAGSVWGYQYRPDVPRTDMKGRQVKYETPWQQRNGLDVRPCVGPKLDDPAVPLWITEGTRKADSAANLGLACISLSGVDCWRGTNAAGGKVALPEWADVALNGRRVVLAFDGDVTRKPGVRSALGKLAGYLSTKGAKVEYLWLPDGDTKIGLDDYIAAGHGVDDLWTLVRPDLPPVAEQQEMPEGEAANPHNPRATVPPPPAETPALAADQRILDRLAGDAHALGVVGERAVVATAYLVLTSRLLDQQASLAVKGHSASGKSFTVETVVSLLPPETVWSTRRCRSGRSSTPTSSTRTAPSCCTRRWRCAKASRTT